MPRHSSSIIPVRATRRRKRVLVSSTHIALVGGRLDLAAFQLTPPLGSSILSPEALATTTGQSRSCEMQPRCSRVFPAVCAKNSNRM